MNRSAPSAELPVGRNLLGWLAAELGCVLRCSSLTVFTRGHGALRPDPGVGGCSGREAPAHKLEPGSIAPRFVEVTDEDGSAAALDRLYAVLRVLVPCCSVGKRSRCGKRSLAKSRREKCAGSLARRFAGGGSWQRPRENKRLSASPTISVSRRLGGRSRGIVTGRDKAMSASSLRVYACGTSVAGIVPRWAASGCACGLGAAEPRCDDTVRSGRHGQRSFT